MGIEIDSFLAKKLVIDNPSVQFSAEPDYVSMIITFEGKEQEYQLSPSYAFSLGAHIINLSQDSQNKGAHLRARSLPPSVYVDTPQQQSLSLWTFIWGNMKSWVGK